MTREELLLEIEKILFPNHNKEEPLTEKKYWDCPQDVVIGAVYRLKGCTAILCPQYFGEGNFMIGDDEYEWSVINILEYSLDGKTWQECLK